MIALDHIAVAGETLAQARAHVEEALGVPLQEGGAHDVFFTHNALLGVEDGLYLEAIAINPEAPTPTRPRWFDLDRFSGRPRLTNWICRTADLDAALEQSPEGMGTPVDLQRGDLRWRMAVPDSGCLPYDNLAPALIEWQSASHPATRLRPSAVRLTRLTVLHPLADDMRASFVPFLSDERVVFEVGEIGLVAVFSTPHGSRELS